MIITDIKPGRKGNILVYADGKYLLSVPREVFLKSSINRGSEITEKEIENITFEINSYKAKSRALNLLSYRAHSKKELEDKLKRKLGEESAKIATEKMEKIGLLNDENYAREFANHLQKNKMYAKKRIAYELSKKGINDEVISDVLNNLEMDEDEALEKIVSKKTIENEEDKRRLIAHLMRLGYSWSQINRFLKSDDY